MCDDIGPHVDTQLWTVKYLELSVVCRSLWCCLLLFVRFWGVLLEGGLKYLGILKVIIAHTFQSINRWNETKFKKPLLKGKSFSVIRLNSISWFMFLRQVSASKGSKKGWQFLWNFNISVESQNVLKPVTAYKWRLF